MNYSKKNLVLFFSLAAVILGGCERSNSSDSSKEELREEAIAQKANEEHLDDNKNVIENTKEYANSEFTLDDDDWYRITIQYQQFVDRVGFLNWARAYEEEHYGNAKRSEPQCNIMEPDALGSMIYALENRGQSQDYRYSVDEKTKINGKLMDVVVTIFSLVDATPQTGSTEVIVFFSGQDKGFTYRPAKYSEWRYVRGLKNCELVKKKMLYQLLAERKAIADEAENFINEYK
jgi:hypothetical protein